MSRMKRFIALLLALLSVLSLAACGTADDNKDDYVKGNTYRLGGGPGTLTVNSILSDNGGTRSKMFTSQPWRCSRSPLNSPPIDPPMTIARRFAFICFIGTTVFFTYCWEGRSLATGC